MRERCCEEKKKSGFQSGRGPETYFGDLGIGIAHRTNPHASHRRRALIGIKSLL